MSAITKKDIMEYLDSQNIKKANAGYHYMIFVLSYMLKNNIGRGNLTLVYQKVSDEIGVPPDTICSDIHTVLKKKTPYMTNKEFLVQAYCTLAFGEKEI